MSNKAKGYATACAGLAVMWFAAFCVSVFFLDNIELVEVPVVGMFVASQIWIAAYAIITSMGE